MAVGTTTVIVLASSLMAKIHAKLSQLSSTYLAKTNSEELKTKIHMPIWQFSKSTAAPLLEKGTS
jgi:hypothetical protein